MNDPVPFIDALLVRVPELLDAFHEHIADNETLLPHVFMGDVTRFALSEAERPNSEVLRILLAHIEEGLNSVNDQVADVILLSFVENLIGEEKGIEVMKPLMGPSLSAAVKRICE